MKTFLSNWVVSIVVVVGAALVGYAEVESLYFEAPVWFAVWLASFVGVVGYKDYHKQDINVTAIQTALMFAVLQVFFPQKLILQYLTWVVFVIW